MADVLKGKCAAVIKQILMVLAVLFVIAVLMKRAILIIVQEDALLGTNGLVLRSL